MTLIRPYIGELSHLFHSALTCIWVGTLDAMSVLGKTLTIICQDSLKCFEFGRQYFPVIFLSSLFDALFCNFQQILRLLHLSEKGQGAASLQIQA